MPLLQVCVHTYTWETLSVCFATCHTQGKAVHWLLKEVSGTCVLYICWGNQTIPDAIYRWGSVVSVTLSSKHTLTQVRAHTHTQNTQLPGSLTPLFPSSGKFPLSPPNHVLCIALSLCRGEGQHVSEMFYQSHTHGPDIIGWRPACTICSGENRISLMSFEICKTSTEIRKAPFVSQFRLMSSNDSVCTLITAF